MGHKSRASRAKHKGTIIHRSKLFGGVKTAAEVHSKEAWKKCSIEKCPNLPVVQIRCFMTLDDFANKAPQMAAAIAASNPDGPFVPTVPMTFGPMVKFSSVCACRSHQSEAEKAASKAPSWVLVEIDRGPGADKPVIQVADTSSLSM